MFGGYYGKPSGRKDAVEKAEEEDKEKAKYDFECSMPYCDGETAIEFSYSPPVQLWGECPECERHRFLYLDAE